MPASLYVMATAVATLAAWVAVHLALTWYVLRAEMVPPLLRALALVPLATPVVGWMAERRRLVLIWLALGAFYLALRVALGG